MQRTCKEMQKVAKCSIGADEVVVANIPRRAPPKGGALLIREKLYYDFLEWYSIEWYY